MMVISHSLSLSLFLARLQLGTNLNSRQNTSSLSGLTYICYSVAAMTQLFLYCYGGNHVGESVSNILRFTLPPFLSLALLSLRLFCFHFVISI